MASSLLPRISDHDQFERLARSVYSKKYRLAFQLSRNRADAEDFTQDALLRACKGYATYEGD
ncbi:MAG: RNA polymerase sigma factor, partial [Fimbriimonadaceae bacterium]